MFKSQGSIIVGPDGVTPITQPVDIQGINLGPGERMPIERAPYNEYGVGQSVSSGGSTFFNHTVTGSKLGLGIRWEGSTSFEIAVGYIVPGTSNVIMIPYEVALTVDSDDNGGVVIDVKNKFARIRIRNTGGSSATIRTLTVVDL
ncbi:hypothetical protein BpsM61_00048 [Bacillus phage vB_BpsM-61]|nr:hypothetical protein BpsM61_00048 [Bacillus phage vB_BpsM-61]